MYDFRLYSSSDKVRNAGSRRSGKGRIFRLGCGRRSRLLRVCSLEGADPADGSPAINQSVGVKIPKEWVGVGHLRQKILAAPGDAVGLPFG